MPTTTSVCSLRRGPQSRFSAAAFPGDASSLASNGGVYNSRYIYPHIKIRPMDNLEFIAAYLVAWPDKADGAVIQCGEGDSEDICNTFDAKDSTSGWELDLGVKYTFHEHINVCIGSHLGEDHGSRSLEAAGSESRRKVLHPAGSRRIRILMFSPPSMLTWIAHAVEAIIAAAIAGPDEDLTLAASKSGQRKCSDGGNTRATRRFGLDRHGAC